MKANRSKPTLRALAVFEKALEEYRCVLSNNFRARIGDEDAEGAYITKILYLFRECPVNQEYRWLFSTLFILVPGKGFEVQAHSLVHKMQAYMKRKKKRLARQKLVD